MLRQAQHERLNCGQCSGDSVSGSLILLIIVKVVLAVIVVMCLYFSERITYSKYDKE